MTGEQQESLDRGINLFNERRLFEAHEESEQEWRLQPEGAEKDFAQGLVIAAVGFSRYQQHECAGTIELLRKSRENLRRGMEDHPDISVGEFLEDFSRLLAPFEACTFGIHPARLPIIRRNLVNG